MEATMDEAVTWKDFGNAERFAFPAATPRSGGLPPRVADFTICSPGHWRFQRWVPARYRSVMAILDGHGLTVIEPGRDDGRTWWCASDQGADAAAERLADEMEVADMEAMGLHLGEVLWLEGCVDAPR
jgi:hypothetical protein